MAARRDLRAVAPGEKPPAPAKKLSVAQAAETGSYKLLLIAQRERLAKAVDDPKCPPRDLAALMRRLAETAKELEAIAAQEAEEAGGAADTPDEELDASAI